MWSGCSLLLGIMSCGRASLIIMQLVMQLHGILSWGYARLFISALHYLISCSHVMMLVLACLLKNMNVITIQLLVTRWCLLH